MSVEGVNPEKRHSTSKNFQANDIPEKTRLDGDDVGVTALTGAVIDIDPNGPKARRVLRKIDLHLMPLLMITYMIQVCSI